MLDGQNFSGEPRPMYKILGADQKEYGPVSADEIRTWIEQGRANGQTLAQMEGGAWKLLSTFPEFAQALGALPAPPMSGLAPSPAPDSQAAKLVQGPGVFLIIVGALGVTLHLISLLARALHLTFAQPNSTGYPDLDNAMNLLAGGAGVALSALAIGLNVLTALGGLRMIKLKNYSLCFAASVIALLPCQSPCCCLGIPAGIWALVVLSRPEIKSAFDKRPDLG